MSHSRDYPLTADTQFEATMEIEKQLDAPAPTGTTDTEEKPLYGRQLERNFNLLSICAVGLVVGNTWVALGGSIVGVTRCLLPSSVF